MGSLAQSTRFETIKVRYDGDLCYIQLHRPEANNAINGTLVDEIAEVLNNCEHQIKIVVFEGLPDVFCFGADFSELQNQFDSGNGPVGQDPKPQYQLWHHMATGPFITIAHVRGKVNAGGIGFVAACDLVLSETKASYSLSELLFGLIPACVMPFLLRRMRFSQANYLTLMTQPITADKALEWGLVDACEDNSENLLRKHLLRLRRLNKTAIGRYKRFMNSLRNDPNAAEATAIATNLEVFRDTDNLQKIARYVKTGQFPWE